jgi:hypothetical protein
MIGMIHFSCVLNFGIREIGVIRGHFIVCYGCTAGVVSE